ncbi:MAG: hypothetical protein KGJ07_07775 [Patescibacteria group bacterium]|nr:hypothetical protein [Patescibacteria group bacterium]
MVTEDVIEFYQVRSTDFKKATRERKAEGTIKSREQAASALFHRFKEFARHTANEDGISENDELIRKRPRPMDNEFPAEDEDDVEEQLQVPHPNNGNLPVTNVFGRDAGNTPSTMRESGTPKESTECNPVRKNTCYLRLTHQQDSVSMADTFPVQCSPFTYVDTNYGLFWVVWRLHIASELVAEVDTKSGSTDIYITHPPPQSYELNGTDLSPSVTSLARLADTKLHTIFQLPDSVDLSRQARKVGNEHFKGLCFNLKNRQETIQSTYTL